MALKPGSADPIVNEADCADGGVYAMYGNPNGETQAGVQEALLIIALLCVPIILLPKPIIKWWQHKHGRFDEHEEEGNLRLIDHDENADQPPHIKIPIKHAPKEEHDEGEFSELFVHQIIETIEFVLGTISNTASYLRLWALSLAHSQLAKVFFGKTLGAAIESGSILGAIVGFYVFALITLGILMLMDVMECFLHALRLHWVEFQNKFYKADGIAFLPFSFENTIKSAKKE